MNYELLNDPNTGKYFVLISILFFAGIEIVLGHYKNTKRTKNVWIFEGMSFIGLSITSFIALGGTIYLGTLFFPNALNSLSHWSLWLAVPFYMIIDDFAQYWYHRYAHESHWMWKHHRPHHAAEEMGISATYRNSFIYYLWLPNVWWAGICTFLGLIPATIIGLIIKQLIVASSHSTWKWDEFLYKIKALSPVMTVVERIIITPAFHHAHHGKSKADGISDPNGNFGNAFSVWDQLFGTALYTRQFPTDYGLPTPAKDNWAAHLFYPFIKSKQPNSEISKGFVKEKTAENEPILMKLEAGTHLWCQCGFSKTQPFCDGSHHGTKYKPIAFEMKKEREVKLCNCKITKTGPFCDNSHLDIKA